MSDEAVKKTIEDMLYTLRAMSSTTLLVPAGSVRRTIERWIGQLSNALSKSESDSVCRQLHPVDRLDGDNPDGNPGPIALLDEAYRLNIVAMRTVVGVVDQLHGQDAATKKTAKSLLKKQRDQLEKIQALRSAIETQGNTV